MALTYTTFYDWFYPPSISLSYHALSFPLPCLPHQQSFLSESHFGTPSEGLIKIEQIPPGSADAACVERVMCAIILAGFSPPLAFSSPFVLQKWRGSEPWHGLMAWFEWSVAFQLHDLRLSLVSGEILQWKACSAAWRMHWGQARRTVRRDHRDHQDWLFQGVHRVRGTTRVYPRSRRDTAHTIGRPCLKTRKTA